TYRTACVARRKSCCTQHRCKRLRQTETAIQFQNDRAARGDWSPHGSGADSRRELLGIPSLVSVARHLLEQAAADGEESPRRDRLGARRLFFEGLCAISG